MGNVQGVQVRRGLKKDLITLPPGEFGYCTDTNELFIGSPAGNVKVATDLDVADIKQNIMAGEDGKPISLEAFLRSQNANKANIYNSVLTLYVRKSGSDTTGTGSTDKPFLTIKKALTEAGKYIFRPNHGLKILLGDGIYDEQIYPSSSFPSLEIASESQNASAVTIRYPDYLVRSTASGFISLSHLTLTGTNPDSTNPIVYLHSPIVGSINSCVINGNGKNMGFMGLKGIFVFNTAVFNNCAPAMNVDSGGDLCVISCTGSGNSVALSTDRCGVIKAHGSIPGATTNYSKSRGGIIFKDGVLV